MNLNYYISQDWDTSLHINDFTLILFDLEHSLNMDPNDPLRTPSMQSFALGSPYSTPSPGSPGGENIAAVGNDQGWDED